jgi:hypothetical protein
MSRIFIFNRLTVAALVASLLVVGGLQAQTTTGRLIGTTTDSDGVGLPGVFPASRSGSPRMC